MSFCSKAWSCETLSRGLGLVDGAQMSIANDPDAAAMQEELDRLLDPRLISNDHSSYNRYPHGGPQDNRY